jgi:predicted dienelactone hydrolase
MRTFLKITGAVVAVLLLLLCGAAANLFSNAAKPRHLVGFEQLQIADPADKPLTVGIWYPSNQAPKRTLIGLSVQQVSMASPVVGQRLPLLVISPGNGGLFSSHSDTALALAADGFVVAAVTHTGDNAEDQSYVGTPRWLVDRPRHIHLLIDYMLNSWPAHGQIDPARVGMFGFSAGGFTALVSIGGVPDLAQIGSHCRSQPEFACSLWKSLPTQSVPDSAWVHDERIKAAVIAAPGYGFSFEPDGLSRVTVPVQLWNGTEDRNVPYETNMAVIRKLLPKATPYHAVPGAAHFSFVAPCPSWLIPLICSNPNDFDRQGFHEQFNQSVSDFLQTQLH